MSINNEAMIAAMFGALGVGLVIASIVGAKIEDWLEIREEREAQDRAG